MSTNKTAVGVIGCGKISGIYFKTMSAMEALAVKSCADAVRERAEAAAEKYGCRAASVEELLADPEIAIVVNLTIPAAHASVAMAAVEAGKSVYNEKPLAVTCAEGRRLLEAAAAKAVRVGGAPDTFLGGGQQTCRKLIDDGAIGQPVAAVAFLISHGHESWHPDPEFYYKPGGGPMFDMGPYYLTALVNLLGPVRRVTGSTRITFPQRVITSQPKAGTTIQVEVPTHVAGVMDFANGAVGTIITTFDVWGANLPHIEVYGTEGSLSVPNPNAFGGPVKLMPPQRQAPWQDIPLTHGYAENSRGLGVADLACALRSGRAHRAGGDLAYHVLEVMHAFQQASEQGRHVLIQSTAPRPAPLPTGLKSGQMDA
ncbi:MAG: Gfo/Idh/MocA family oxidoreductase [Phycisphaerae bacterium]|jgi:predicted dehydrogenase